MNFDVAYVSSDNTFVKRLRISRHILTSIN